MTLSALSAANPRLIPSILTSIENIGQRYLQLCARATSIADISPHLCSFYQIIKNIDEGSYFVMLPAFVYSSSPLRSSAPAPPAAEHTNDKKRKALDQPGEGSSNPHPNPDWQFLASNKHGKKI